MDVGIIVIILVCTVLLAVIVGVYLNKKGTNSCDYFIPLNVLYKAGEAGKNGANPYSVIAGYFDELADADSALAKSGDRNGSRARAKYVIPSDVLKEIGMFSKGYNAIGIHFNKKALELDSSRAKAAAVRERLLESIHKYYDSRPQ